MDEILSKGKKIENSTLSISDIEWNKNSKFVDIQQFSNPPQSHFDKGGLRGILLKRLASCYVSTSILLGVAGGRLIPAYRK